MHYRAIISCYITMAVSSWTLSLLLCGFVFFTSTIIKTNVVYAAKTAGGNGSGSGTSRDSNSVKRIGNLDYLDAATVRYYLSEPRVNYDVTILFYAQWCKNCHALAPVWDQISRILKAGTTDSNVIVGLFDCEASKEHEDVCTTARVKHYPTIAYLSMAGNKLSPMSEKPHHMVHYHANWQIGEAILDWIRAMSALSRWQRAGWGQWVRQIMLGKPRRRSRPVAPPATTAPQTAATVTVSSETAEALPIGVPAAITNEIELSKLRLKVNESNTLSIRSSTFVETLLFPVQAKRPSPLDATTATTGKSVSPTSIPSLRNDGTGGKNYTDVYAMLHQQKAWQSIQPLDEVVRTCVSELAMDYCTRVSTNYMEAWIESWPLHQKVTDAVIQNFTTQLQDDLKVNEPFCAIMDNCTLSNFVGVECQPKECPFADHMACRYLTACLTPQIQHEYAEALELYPYQQKTKQPAKDKDTKKQPARKGGTGFKWGL